MPFNAIRENIILAKISGFTIFYHFRERGSMCVSWASKRNHPWLFISCSTGNAGPEEIFYWIRDNMFCSRIMHFNTGTHEW